MTFQSALEVLERRQETRIELGLDRVRSVLARLGEPQEAVPCVHVAGTNGKGSVCAILESVLRRQGYRTGLYTSPHLLDVRERIRVCGRPIPAADFARLLARVLRAEKGARLTYFELLTCVAFLHFRERGVEAGVLETGLGGRLDATNVVRRPLACVITSIDYDHTAFLGKTLPRIAAEKAGILKRGVPAYCPSLAPAALAVIRRRARAVRAPLTVVREAFAAQRIDWRANRQLLRSSAGEVWALGLLGGRQGRNAALARAALDGLSSALPVSGEAWREGLARVRWPGRFEVRPQGRRAAILDGAHNPEAVRSLAATWRASPWSRGRARWILGVMRDKDARGILRQLAPHLRDVVAVTPPSPRALAAGDLARLVRRYAPTTRVAVEPDAEAALRAWRRAPGLPAAVVCGSFYLVAAASRQLSRGARG